MTAQHYSPSYPAWVFERAFGGLGTAIAPRGRIESENWPIGRSAPYSKSACQEVVEACRGESKKQVLVFLVGGAGNGKSKLASDVVADLKCDQDEPAAFAQRAYDYALENGKSLLIVNDATIPPDEATGDTSPLVAEIDKVLQSGANLLACVNRGVLIGEFASLSDTGTPGRRIGKALLGESSSSDDGIQLHDNSLSGVYQSFSATGPNGNEFEVRIVYMDNASLLEYWPCEGETSLLKQSLVGSGVGQGEQRVFASLLNEFSLNFLSASNGANSLDPIAANAESFSRPEAAQSWCGVARGAEIMSGNHFTYRELWAVACYSIIGEATLSSLDGLESEIAGSIKAVGDKPKLETIEALACHRAHMKLFGGLHRSAAVTASSALDALNAADPLRGFGQKRGEHYFVSLALLATIEEGDLPMSSLVGSEEGLEIIPYWTSFDAWVEESCRALLDHEVSAPDAQERKRVLSFYGNYMFRLIGLARGWPAQVPVIQEWQRAWNYAQENSTLPDNLASALKALVLPDAIGNQRTAFPVFRGRVESLSPGDKAITIDLDTGRFHIVAKSIGSMIEFELRDYQKGEERIAGGLLDFHLVRECMVRMPGSGFSDALMSVEPRVERIRSGVVASALAATQGQVRYRLYEA